MSLTALAHTFHTTAHPSANNIEGWLNELYDTLNGNMTGWDVGREQPGGTTEAVYFTPKAGTQAESDGLRVILAGADSGSPTPPLGLNESAWTTGRLYIGLAYNGGAFNSAGNGWHDSAPFTSGQFSGYFAVADDAQNSVSTFELAESAESIHLQVTDGSAVEGGGIAGALIDAESTAASNSINADGRVFAVMTTYYTQPPDYHEFGVSVSAWTHGSGSASKAVFLETDGVTWDSLFVGPRISSSNIPDPRQISSRPWMLPIYVWEQDSPYHILGRLREIYLGPRAINRDQLYDDAGNAIARLWANSFADASHSIAIKF